MFGREPAVIIGAIMALLMLAIGFGLKINGSQVDLIKLFLESLAPLVAGVAIRTQVSPKQDVQTALDQPKGTSVDTLKEVIKEKNAQ